jgi:hypothetical protein
VSRLAWLGLGVLITGCASSGTYFIGGSFWYETLTLRRDHSFEFLKWGDDGGTQCKALGTWELGSKGRTIVTNVVTLEPPGTASCVLKERQEWRRGVTSLEDPRGKRFRFTRLRFLP